MATKKLGSVSPSATTNTTLYTVPAGTSAVCILSICNTNATTTKIRVAISATDTPTIDEYIEYDIALIANGVLERSSIAMGENEKLVVYSNTANVAFRLYGIEE